MNEWIDVNDRLPEVGDAVIATKNLKEERWYGCCIYRAFGFPWVLFNEPNPIDYWMPLPPPPDKEEG